MSNEVLIIEDSRAFASMVSNTLTQRYHYIPVVAETHAAAEALLAENPNRFFVAVVDLNLPDAPNGEAVQLTTERKIPSIVFTGQVNEGLREDIFSRGVSDYVLKSGTHNIDYVADVIHRFDCNRRVKVLVVDDSITARRQMKRLLITQCYQVIEAESGLTALGALQENPDISIVITDCHMDGMDGFELTQTLRQTNSKEKMAIIGVSSQGGSSISAQFIKSGADDFIVKPFIQEEFTCRINKNAETLELFTHLNELNAQKNFLMGMAAHDIRNPLGIINRIVKRAQGGNTTAERMTEYLGMIHKSSENLLELLSDILEISKLEGKEIAIEKEAFVVETLLVERIDILQTRANEKGIEISRDLVPNVPVPMDAGRISQVVDNLLSNALKFSTQGTTVTVNSYIEENNLFVNVCDQGQGINEEEQSLLFEAFTQLSAKPTDGESTTGLGLAICKSIVEAHNGKIGYERTHDGSRFYFALPLTS
ncbi:hypothetical protein A9Q99_27185 [Gammaproteobacteria bacterium 45_16_T64]|nr:hypothetical protein A9Q99_27185 [Gammaproteobacteria bacterium 45_16_T64]